MAEPALRPSIPAQVGWVFRVLDRIAAGESIPCAEIAEHYVPWFLDNVSPEQILTNLCGASAVASSMVALDPEFLLQRGTAIGLVSTHRDGRRYRWEFDIESDRLCLQVLARGPLPEYRDHTIEGPNARLLVRDYPSETSGPVHVLLLHSFGADVGCWDLVAKHLASTARLRALDLRGHGRSDPQYGYSLQGCLDDIAAATGDVASRDLVLVGHSLGGYVALEYAARRPCRAVITLDGPASMQRSDTEEEIAATPEPLHSVLAEHAHTDYGRLIADLTTPALIGLVQDSAGQPSDDETERQQLAAWAIQHGHSVRWLDIPHGAITDDAEPTARLISDFLTTVGPLAPLPRPGALS